jgi:[acyl-carrier-protein] S-malonyltransferase
MILHRMHIRNLTKVSPLRCSNKIKDLLDNAATGDDSTPQNQADIWSTSPYPTGAIHNNRDQSKKSNRPRTDPRETSIVLFPGQGSQYVGMAKKLVKIPEARDMFEIANQVLG